jgi:hypothetical protein
LPARVDAHMHPRHKRKRACAHTNVFTAKAVQSTGGVWGGGVVIVGGNGHSAIRSIAVTRLKSTGDGSRSRRRCSSSPATTCGSSHVFKSTTMPEGQYHTTQHNTTGPREGESGQAPNQHPQLVETHPTSTATQKFRAEVTGQAVGVSRPA